MRRLFSCESADGATVMMGGLLESLFLARVNREPSQAAVFSSKAAPKGSQDLGA